MGPVNPPGAHAVWLRDAVPGLLGVPLRDQQIAAYVGQRDVVLRVIRPLPDIERPGSVQHLLTAQERPDAGGYRLRVVDRGDHRRVVVHGVAPSVLVKGLFGAGIRYRNQAGAGRLALAHLAWRRSILRWRA